jgi:hypothetical protein
LHSLAQAILKVVLSIVLLIHIDFTTTYFPVRDYNLVLTGIAPFNASLTQNSGVSSILPFFFDELSLQFLWDPTAAIEAPPVTEQCRNAGDSCYSYIFPGTMQNMELIKPLPGGSTPGNVSNFTVSEAIDLEVAPFLPLDYTEEERHGATSYIVLNATTYQVEFFPLQESVGFNNDDCQYLGNGDINSPNSPLPVKMCIKGIGEDLAIGMFVS